MENIKEILSSVQKPGRYTGGEVNSVVKKWDKDRTRVVLSYPDSYEVGMSYLGLKILYHLLNEMDEVVCERVFMPWPDMTEELKKRERKLFSLESREPLSSFDIVGFSLSYELTYTNVLSMLELGGIKVKAEDRADGEVLVIAGGACAYNPEPMSAFFDAFIIGDAEEVLPEFIRKYRDLKKKSSSRKEILKELSHIEGVYIPSFYKAEYEAGEFLCTRPVEEGVPEVIKKRSVEDFENTFYPEKQIVPSIKIVHDRIAVEIMRGCPNRCRFCQASAVNRPVRIRSAECVRSICRKSYEYTGNERIALLSLSSVNYPYLVELTRALNEDFKGKGVGLSIPSLRVDEAFYELPEMISIIRKAGLTFAPESASDAVRSKIGKDIDMEVLCRSASIAYRHGWKRIKLYFMVGFSAEAEDEVADIIDLAWKLSKMKGEFSRGRAEVKVSVNAFIPKAHTAFQWLGMQNKSLLEQKKKALFSGRGKKVHIEFSSLDQSILEACLSRGGRDLSEVIYKAWKNGSCMDSWNEFFTKDAWEEAFSSLGLDMEEYASRRYALTDSLPWQHIDTGVSTEFLKKELSSSGLY